MSYQDPASQIAVKSLYEKLSHVQISSVLAHRRRRKGAEAGAVPLIAVPDTTPVGEVLHTLRTESILAVPVYSESAAGAAGKQFIGIVSVYDILAYTVFQQLFDELKAKTLTNVVINNIMEEEDKYFGTPIKSLLGLTKESQETWSLSSTSPVSSLLQMVTGAPYHRILIVDDDAIKAASASGDQDSPASDGSFTTMVTQTDLLAFLVDDPENRPALEAVFKIPAKELYSLAHRRTQSQNKPAHSQRAGPAFAGHNGKLVTFPVSASAIEAFRAMHEHGVSAMAIVEERGALVANLSASDLRGISPSNLECLLDNVYQFLEVDIRRRPDQVKADQLRYITDKAQAGDVVKLMLDSHIHRIWIADEGEKPTGVVTMSDVLVAFVPDSILAVEQ